MSTVARKLAPTLMVAALVALSACGGDTGNATDPGGQGGDSAKPESISYWSHWKEGENQQKVLAEAIAAWEEETGITVEAQWQGRTITQKLTPALNTNNVPDLVDSSFARLAPVLAETGQYASMQPAFEKTLEDDTSVADLIPKKYIEGSGLQIDGEPWMLPYTISSEAIWFNGAQHPELKESPPKTWDEFTALLDDLKAAGEVPLALDGDIGGYNAMWFVSGYVREHGPGSFAELVADESGESWKSDEVRAMAERVEALVQQDVFIDGYNASKFPAQQQEWATNKAALLLNGSWIPTETGTYAAEGFEFASFPMPTEQQDKVYTRTDFIGFAIPSKSDAVDWAADLAAFTLQKEYQEKFASEAKVLPVRDDIEVSPELAGVMSEIEKADAVYQQNDAVSHPGYIEKVFWPIHNELVLGNIGADEFINRMAEAQAQYWQDQS
ncbi:ABC transporter substrate-binding protein [Tessaracoccus oleiagri]|uniref:Raffinose/stachyose/melibiose transport system substrate-binding protein n=1 Tax=Tessaracoccus oleiagri TaxID=686624 RepID=A0A1G9N1D7_9ACTN|nr:ABC transporter substrate-binding protein [Tessaracoccus oleiagri]SDL80330.1 raffinose/stachyose/melibiose transport system substrate-binding protein [Tessaracoccus oleiagri]